MLIPSTIESMSVRERLDAIELPCGAPIAQLVFFKADELGQAEDIGLTRKACPIRPEFAQLKQMPDWRKLETVRKSLVSP